MTPIPKLPTLEKLKWVYSLVLAVFCVSAAVWMIRSDGIFQISSLTYPVLQPSVTPTVAQNMTAGFKVLRGQPASLVRVNGSRTLLISAYLEHRTRTKKVLVIAIMFRKEKVSLQCSLRCREQLHVSRASVDIHWDHFGFPYGTADVSCPLPPACQAPTHVAVTSAAIRNPADQSDMEYLEVWNQRALTSFPYTFTSCFSTMYNYTNVLQLVQSLEMLQFLGVNRVVIYKMNCSAETQRVLDYYSDKGLVEVVPWSLSKYLNVSRRAKPDQDPGDIHYFGQIPALNDCLYRSMYRSKYVALHDPDELILPQLVNSWVELLPLLERKYGVNKCYKFENNWVPSEFALTPPAPQTLPQLDRWQNVSGVNILNHVYIEPAPRKPVFNNYKIITNPRSVYSVTVHGVLRSQGGCAWTDRRIARMYHVKPRGQTELKPEQLIYDGRLLKYSSRLVSAVNIVLRDNGLLPKDAM
ncbi:PREDICTED: uncharacterized protein LOC106906729 isoform X1 [Poecilia mexicana]|uniref:Glycosyltransferase family 92 protein n=1 Tax=Poecilia formosa TaxID=48698 RepID=A0A087XJ45_POEFO|nr:PREDICTED: uncharacterized protein LOC103152945 isoform X1 [Poecilia formosa]XP_014827611.1 PREDICTED: uncharacterized protein LOC106906729 isoform X1 [Poecilia mexicana]